MANQEAMSLQARRARPVVATGIALATAGVLVAVPAKAPPLTPRDAQVAADVQTALSTARVNLAALSDALAAFQAGGPVGALLAGLLGPEAQTAFQDGGPVGAALFALGVDPALVTAFQGGGPVGLVLTALAGNNAAAQGLVTAFQGGGPVGLVLTALAGNNAAAQAVVTGFQDGGPLGAVIAAILGPPPEDPTVDVASITSVDGLSSRNAATNAGRSFVDLSTPSQADAGDQSVPAIEAKAEAPKPLRAALPKPLQAVVPKPLQAVLPEAPVVEVPKAPVVEVPKAPVVEVPKKTDDGTKGAGEGNGLVRNSLQFKPNTILPVGSESGAGAGGAWNPFQGIKDAIDRFTGGGGSLTGSANATDGGAENGDGKG
jgi:hypothetical protein